jgi:hypothetical protein
MASLSSSPDLMTPPELSYEDVFEEDARSYWEKLRDNDRQSRLWARFWGKDILGDARRKWHKMQTSDDQMDLDTEAPVPFPFDIGIDAFNVSTVWVRNDYTLLYDYCTNRFASPVVQTKNAKPLTIIISGQPGIGK